MTERILAGDCRETLKDVESGTVHCCVTSPPYWGLRAYIDDPREIGREATPEEHLANLVDVFREVRRVLRDDGTVWINYGDAYATPKVGYTRDTLPIQGQDRIHQECARDAERLRFKKDLAPGYKPKDLLSMPFRVVEALRQDGWYHRSTIVWSKKSPMPESVSGTRWERCRVKVGRKPANFRSNKYVNQGEAPSNSDHMGTDGNEVTTWSPCPGCSKCEANGGYVLRINAGRPTTSMEYVFLVTKSPSYFYNMDGNRVALATEPHGRGGDPDSERIAVYHTPGEISRDTERAWGSNQGRNLWTVWDDIKQSNYKGAHFATMPLDLALRCVKLGTSDYGCCPTCGAQWAPVVETTPEYDAWKNREQDAGGWTKRSGDLEKGRGTAGGGTNSATVPPNNIITEWRPTCTCENNEGGRPVVLDPFGGSLTTVDAARECGCDSICCELNEEYVALGKKRVEQGVFL